MLQADLLKLDDDSLVELVREELADIIGLSGQPELVRVVRWNDAMPQYNLGHSARVKRIEAAIDNVDGLWLATNALHGVGIAPVIGQAGQIADSVVASLSDSGDTPSRDRIGSRSAFEG